MIKSCQKLSKDHCNQNLSGRGDLASALAIEIEQVPIKEGMATQPKPPAITARSERPYSQVSKTLKRIITRKHPAFTENPGK